MSKMASYDRIVFEDYDPASFVNLTGLGAVRGGMQRYCSDACGRAGKRQAARELRERKRAA